VFLLLADGTARLVEREDGCSGCNDGSEGMA